LPKTRHPASVLVATVALAAAAVWWPEPALLAAEAAVLGLVLALVAGLLSYTLGRRRQLLPWGEMPGSAVGSSVLSARTPHPAAAAPPAPPPAAPPSTSPPTPQSK
jgi:hypothetical protein